MPDAGIVAFAAHRIGGAVDGAVHFHLIPGDKSGQICKVAQTQYGIGVAVDFVPHHGDDPLRIRAGQGADALDVGVTLIPEKGPVCSPLVPAVACGAAPAFGRRPLGRAAAG